MKKNAFMIILFSTLLLCQTIFAIVPGDLWSFKLIGYQYVITDESSTLPLNSHLLIPPDFPSVENLLMFPIDPSQPAPRWKYKENDVVIKSICFKDEKFIELHYQGGKIVEGVFWGIEIMSTDGEKYGYPMGFPLYTLSYLDEHHDSKSLLITPDLNGGGNMQIEVPVFGTSNTVFLLYHVDFQESNLPEIDDVGKRYNDLRILL